MLNVDQSPKLLGQCHILIAWWHRDTPSGYFTYWLIHDVAQSSTGMLINNIKKLLHLKGSRSMVELQTSELDVGLYLQEKRVKKKRFAVKEMLIFSIILRTVLPSSSDEDVLRLSTRQGILSMLAYPFS